MLSKQSLKIQLSRYTTWMHMTRIVMAYPCSKAVLMANLSSCDPEVLFESQDAVIQDTNPSTPNDLLVLSLVEQMTDHIAHLDKENQTNKMFFYDDTHKQALGYRNPFHLKKDQKIQPTLYDGSVIAKQHAVISVLDDEETLLLEEESLSKKLDKQNDPIFIENKIKISPIEYSKLNKIKEDFVKSLIPVKIKAPSELPKSVENSDLNAQLQEKVFAIIALKNELRKLKGKNVVNTMVSKPNATIALGMFKLDIEPISPRLKNNKDAHEVYIKKAIEYTDTLRGFVERAKTQYPSEPLLESACMFTKHVRELLLYASQTCPNSPKPSENLVVVTPSNKDKRVRFAELVTSSNNIPKQTNSLKTKDFNKPLLTSTGVKPTTSASRSKPSGNTKNNRIMRPPRSNQKNKVEDHPRKVKSSLNKTNSVSEPISNALVKHFVRNANFESTCAIYNKCLFDANHDMCLVDFVNDCMTKSSNNELFTPYEEHEREFRSSRRHFKSQSLDELRSPNFSLFSDQEYSKEEKEKAMKETMEQYTSKTRTDYGSGVARPKIEEKHSFELKGQFLKELRENTFSGSDNEDVNEHIEKFLEIVDLFHVPNITEDQLMLQVFPISLTRAISRWIRNKLTSSIKT
ncbi:hypothetical protein Tco_0109686 [Tanacetum coccineum]